jgi:restriction endonuclease S subunit
LAQSKKLELLKEHKKGLMQQLFPNHPVLADTSPKEGNKYIET